MEIFLDIYDFWHFPIFHKIFYFWRIFEIFGRFLETLKIFEFYKIV